MKVRFLIISLVIWIAGALPASAASILWDWSFTAQGITASGTFTTNDTPDASGGYLITAITGTRNGKAITGLQPTGTPIPGNEPYDVDNLVFLAPNPQLTKAGFGFSLADGTYSNPFYADFLSPPIYLEFFSNPPGSDHTELEIQFSATPRVPEPATFGLVLSGFALLYVRSRVLR